MQRIFNQFKEKFNGKSLNEILGCAKFSCEGLQLVKDVDEYDNNEFAFVVGWYPNDEFNPNERIEVECLYSHLTGDAEFTLLHPKVTKFNRTWEIVHKLNLNRIVGDCPVWWEVLEMENGTLFMNNLDGEMAFIEDNGRILKTSF